MPHFQKKCLGKINEASRQEGRTVLLVSHNLAAVAELAERALLLDAGSIAVDGSVAEAVSIYLSRGARKSNYIRPLEPQVASPHLAQVEVSTSDPNAVHRFGEPLEIKFWISHLKPKNNCIFCFQIFSSQFNFPVICSSYYYGDTFDISGCSLVICRFPRILLNIGQFHLCTYLQDSRSGYTYDHLDGICAFEVIRIDKNPHAGWRSEVCAYHEDHAWTLVDVTSNVAVGAKST